MKQPINILWSNANPWWTHEEFGRALLKEYFAKILAKALEDYEPAGEDAAPAPAEAAAKQQPAARDIRVAQGTVPTFAFRGNGTPDPAAQPGDIPLEMGPDPANIPSWGSAKAAPAKAAPAAGTDQGQSPLPPPVQAQQLLQQL